jgi:hypothetical protein
LVSAIDTKNISNYVCFQRLQKGEWGMKKSLELFGLIVLFCLTSSCNKATPTTPTTTTPTTTTTIPVATIVSVSVPSSNSAIVVGSTEQMTATVTMSDGTKKAGTGTWSSDNTSVATVNQSGLVTANAVGTATIIFDTSGNMNSGAPGDVRDTTKVDGPSNARGTINPNASGGMRRALIPSASNGVRGTKNSSTMPDARVALNYSAPVTVRGTKLMTVRNLWSKSGVGATVFDMPTYVSRVRIAGTYTGTGENFVVWIGSDLVVNEILGTWWGQTTYSGTFLTSGGVVQVKYSNGLSWSFTEVPRTTAIANAQRKMPVYSGQSGFGTREYEIYLREEGRRR